MSETQTTEIHESLHAGEVIGCRALRRAPRQPSMYVGRTVYVPYTGASSLLGDSAYALLSPLPDGQASKHATHTEQCLGIDGDVVVDGGPVPIEEVAKWAACPGAVVL